MNGIIVMDKPAGFTSFDVVAVMRGVCHTKKAGHTGTLDPMATGVLPLLFGSATRAASLLPDTGKEYVAGFKLGFATDTQDITGKTTAQSGVRVKRADVEEILPMFRGEIMQAPPMYSAVSVGGKRLYELARKGIEVERQKRPVSIYTLELLDFDENDMSGRLKVSCSKGTYIRTICSDIGDALKTYGVMSSLRRTRAGIFAESDCVTLDAAKRLSAEGKLSDILLPVETLFVPYPQLRVSEAQAKRFTNGGALKISYTALRDTNAGEGDIYRIMSPDGVFLGLGNICGEDVRILRLFTQGH